MDPRRGNAKCHELLDILTIALLASVCGANNCVDFAEFAEDGEALPREFLSLENGLPFPAPSAGCSACSIRPPSANAFQTNDADHGRVETRRQRVTRHVALDLLQSPPHAR